MTLPRVSILVPAFNVEPYVDDALRTLLSQDFKDFELIVCDDGSSDRTWERLCAIHDDRVVLIRNAVNRGISQTRNRLLDHARGDILALADADDLYDPHRLSVQVDFLDRHPDYSVVSACLRLLVEGRPRQATVPGPLNLDNLLRWRMLFSCPLNNPVTCIRRAHLDGLRYPSAYVGAEDYWLWWQLSRRGRRMALLPDFLMDYRVHPGSISHQRAAAIAEATMEIRLGVFADRFGAPLEASRVPVHLDLVDDKRRFKAGEHERIQRVIEWIVELSRRLPAGEDRRYLLLLAQLALSAKGVRFNLPADA